MVVGRPFCAQVWSPFADLWAEFFRQDSCRQVRHRALGWPLRCSVTVFSGVIGWPFGHVLNCTGGGRCDLDGRGSLGRVGDQQMVWIAAGLSDTLTNRKVMLQIHASRDWPLTGLIKNPVGLQFLVAGVQPAVPVGVSRSPEFPTLGIRQNLDQVDKLLHGEGHIQQNTRFNKLVVRRGVVWCHFWCHFCLVFSAIWCLKVPLFHKMKRPRQTVFGPVLCVYCIDFIEFIWRRGRDSNPR